MAFPKMWLSMVLAGLFAVMAVTAAHSGNPVTFHLNIPNLNIQVGETFTIQVLLDAPAGPPSSAVKDVAFTLSPSSGVTISSATSGNLLDGASITPNRAEASGGYSYGELTTRSAASGTNLIFVTLTARANTAGLIIFSFSNLRAAQGSVHRLASGTPSTVTITAAAPAIFSCTGEIPDDGTLCNDDDTGLTADTSITTVTTCGNVKCEYICNGGFNPQSNLCAQDSTPPPSPQISRLQKLIQRISELNEAEVPDEWTPTFISRMARLLREVFADR